MTEIDLKFTQEMMVKILSGGKCCTSRRRIHGLPGDTFRIGEHRYRIIQVTEMYADQIAQDLYRAEGFTSPDAFSNWFIRNKKMFDPNQTLYVHFFAAILPLV